MREGLAETPVTVLASQSSGVSGTLLIGLGGMAEILDSGWFRDGGRAGPGRGRGKNRAAGGKDFKPWRMPYLATGLRIRVLDGAEANRLYCRWCGS